MGSTPPWEAPRLPVFSSDMDPVLRAAFEQQAQFMLDLHRSMMAAIGYAESGATAHPAEPQGSTAPEPAAAPQAAPSAAPQAAPQVAPQAAPTPAPAPTASTSRVPIPHVPWIHGTPRQRELRRLHQRNAVFFVPTVDGRLMTTSVPPPGWGRHRGPEGPILRAAKAAAGFPGYEEEAVAPNAKDAPAAATPAASTTPAQEAGPSSVAASASDRSRSPSPASSTSSKGKKRARDEDADEAPAEEAPADDEAVAEPAQAPEGDEERPARRRRTTPSPPASPRSRRSSPRLAEKKNKARSP
ncbi:hypothetical protein FA95DRAFT_1596236 [Auriscalpium vulgare]|uniref:Uncharacterized protein n=1 Tax=Auriscalpium vulgare TaxID=40419 RepID=A0ACB8RQR0_9AGAM|nr:hypothetical protein FA95DRAFT_1596236 [Auriscalpium vulgare]